MKRTSIIHQNIASIENSQSIAAKVVMVLLASATNFFDPHVPPCVSQAKNYVFLDAAFRGTIPLALSTPSEKQVIFVFFGP